MGQIAVSSGMLTAQTALTEYLRRYAEPNRYDNYELRQFGTEAIQPAGMGLNIYAPTFTKSVVSLRGSEKTLDGNSILKDSSTSGRGMSFGNYSGSLQYYYDYFEIAKVFAASATLRGYLERGAEWLMKGVALTEEEIIQEHLYTTSWSTSKTLRDDTAWLACGADGTTGNTWGTSYPAQGLTVEALAQARKLLRKNRNPGFSQLGRKFAGVVSPDALYQLLTNASTGTLRLEQESMNMTAAFRNNVVGDLFGIRLFETTNPFTFQNGTDSGLPFAADGQFAVVLAPDAFYVASHETLNPQLYYRGFGETSSPVNNFATLGVDFMTDAFGPTGGGSQNTKMVVIPHTE